MNVVSCYERQTEFDIIHNHTPYEGMTLANLVRTPILTTMHNGLLHKEWIPMFMRYRWWYNTISRAAWSLIPHNKNYAGSVYNAVNAFSYNFNPGARSNFLLFLSRFSPEKGADLAIKVARKLRIPLIMAGNIHPKDQEYFRTKIRPYVDGKNVICEGQVSDSRKKYLLSEAKCLLAPITWPEPFGLFMVEAMASGTPVVALNYGSAPEVVRHGVTGFVVDSAEEMVQAARRIDKIDPWICRKHVVDNFDAPILANNYLKVYQRIISESKEIEQKPLTLR
jgi:glycosyltransferase involved in cell wall biosynthesis